MSPRNSTDRGSPRICARGPWPAGKKAAASFHLQPSPFDKPRKPFMTPLLERSQGLLPLSSLRASPSPLKRGGQVSPGDSGVSTGDWPPLARPRAAGQSSGGGAGGAQVPAARQRPLLA